MNKNRNKVAAMMMVAAITVSSVAMPVEAAVSSVESVGIERGNNVYEEGDIDLEKEIVDKKFRDIIIQNIKYMNNNGENIDISNDIIKQKDIEKITWFQGYPSNPTDLTGIEKFTALKSVWIDGVSKIDLSKNSLITNVNLEGNKLKTLDLKGNPELTRLNITNGNIESLDLSNNTNLKELHCGENKLKYLDLSNNTKLSFLSLDESRYANNGIGYLKLDENVVLKNGLNESSSIKKIFEQSVDVLVDKENDKQIDLSKEFPGINPDDIILEANQGISKEGSIIKWEKFPEKPIRYTYRTQGKDNGILLKVALYIGDNEGITEGVVINKKNFPDDEFRKYLCSDSFTEDHNSMSGGWNFEEGETIPANILRMIKKINLSSNDLKNLKGIEHFKNLEELNCGFSRISNLNISQNKKLRKLDCRANLLSTLDVSNNPKLTSLICLDNKLTNLNLENNTELLELDVSLNLLSNLNIENNDKLRDLKIFGNKDISDIKLSDKANLAVFHCGNNNIEKLNLESNINLGELDIMYSDHEGKYIKNLNTSKNINLYSLSYRGDKNLDNIDVSKNVNLTNLYLENNNIKDIDVSKNEKLNGLTLFKTKIRNLDLSNNEVITDLRITNSEIGKMIVNKDTGTWLIREGDHQYINLKPENNTIDLKNEFGITDDEMKNVTAISSDLNNTIEKKGTKLVWSGKTPNKIKYTYLCEAKNEPIRLYVTLNLNGTSSDITNPDKPNPNPNPGGGSGGGTTTPDQKPDQKPDEKPNKPVNISARIMGKNRYETAAKIADELVKNNISYNSVILVNSDKSMADGLSAASLSGKKNAPILLVKKDSIPAEAMSKIEKAKNVYIIGGEGAISKNVENQLKGKNITRISGKDRYETSAKIANMLGGYKMAFIVNGAKGEADAMSVSSVAAKYGAPILLTNGKTSTHPVKAGVSYFVIGGRGVVSNQLADKYNADRIAGIDRYSTNRKVIDEFYYDSKKVYFAKGDTLVDALTASLLAKENGMVLVSKNANHKKLEGKEAVQVGGMDFEISFE